MVAEDGKDDLEGTSSDSQPAPGLLEYGVELMSTTIPHATPNPNVTVRNLNTDIHDSPISSINEEEQISMTEYIERRVKEATEVAVLEYQTRLAKRASTSAVAGVTQGDNAPKCADPQPNTSALQFAQNVYRHKKSTPESVIDYLKQNRINSQKTKRSILREMHNQIASCGLLTMLLGQRVRPEYTEENPTGFIKCKYIVAKYDSSVDDNNSEVSEKSDGSIADINLVRNFLRSPSIWLSDDNIELFQHDESRLLVIVRHMFHEIHHPFGETHYRNHEPVKYYNALYNHVFSKRAKDLDRHQTDLQNFKPNTALSFVNDYRRWCDIFDEVRMIQNSPIPQATLQAFLDKHYTYDPRPAISGALSHARNSKWSFDETISAIIDADERSPTGIKHPLYGVSQSSTSVQPQKSDSEKPIKYCDKFQTNTCTRSASECKYVHKMRPASVPPRTDKQVSNTSAKPVTQHHRQGSLQTEDYQSHPLYHASIGPPNGLVGKKNPYGFSQKQRKDMLDISQRSQTQSQTPSQSGDARKFISWSDENKPGYSPKRADIRVMRVEKRKYENDVTAAGDTDAHQEWITTPTPLSPIHIDHETLDNTESDDRSSIQSLPHVMNSDRPRSLHREEPISSIEEHNASLPCQPDISYAPPLQMDMNQPPEVRPHQKLHISSIDAPWNKWNQEQISDRLKSMTRTIPQHPFNNHIVSAYHRAFQYYMDGNLIRYYDRNDPTKSIRPTAFFYRINDDPDNPIHNFHLKLFSFNTRSPALREHSRTDIIDYNINERFMCLMYQLSQIMCGSICTFFDMDRPNIPNFSIEDQYYIEPDDDGYYYSMTGHYSEFVRHVEAIMMMDYENSGVTNHLLTDTLILAIIWDFQAWVAQTLSSVQFSIPGVAFLRKLIMQDIESTKSNAIEQLQLFKVFNYIASNTSPYVSNSHTYMNGRYMRLYQAQFPHGSHCHFFSADNVKKSCNINLICSIYVSTNLMSVRQNHQRLIIDTGASVSATSNKDILKNVKPCNDMIAYPAFGPQIAPTLRGEFGKFNLDTVVIDNMPDTLISVSQICEGGSSNKHNVAVFTTEGVRIFEFDSIRKALKLMDSDGVEVLRGFSQDGVYVTDSDNDIRHTHSLFLAKFKPVSMYDHIHLVTNHPGERGMQWHRENSINGKYTDTDVNRNRGVCRGCVYGSLHQTPTDPYRDHRPIPLIPGQCFALDAYTHSIRSSRGHLYCDILTDLATRRHYPVFTKDRSSHELCEKTRQLFLKHPEWQSNASRSQSRFITIDSEGHDKSIELNEYQSKLRFIRLDSESSYKSVEFLTLASSLGYILEHTPVRDKHAGGIAERAVGLISAKTNIAMLACEPPVPASFWDYAMTYACDTHSYNFCSAIGTSPYMKITGQPINIKYLQPFWASCYVFIPLKDRIKVGAPRAYKAHFVGYANTSILFPNYIVIPVSDDNNYSRHRESKDVIFDPSINFSVYTDDEEPYDREFVNTDHYIPFLDRVNAPATLKGPHATPVLEGDASDNYTPILPTRSTHTEYTPVRNMLSEQAEDNESNLNTYNVPYDDEYGSPVYWYQFYVRNQEYPLAMCETQHFYKIKQIKDPLVPRNYYKAMQNPLWATAIDKELVKFEKNLCLQIVPYNGQHLVPMMWTFVIKTDGTKKARLVGRGDLMIPYIDFDPNAVYCGNVTACSIKMCVAIAAKYKLEMMGGDLEGAYLVTRANPDYPVYIKTPEGYTIPKGTCMQAVGNLYGFPPAGQNFSIEFDKCVKECGYTNTPWDLKFFIKWKDGKPMLLIAHSDDFRWFGDKTQLSEWKLLVDTFEKHKYKVSDVTDSEFVGIQITHDRDYNYYMNQTRMIDEIMTEAQMKNAKDARLPYPLQGEPLSKLDNATEKNYEECQKFPYRKIVGQLMYGMVHTLVTIAYALNVLSRYGNNPGPRHIEFAKHLLKYVRSIKTDRLKFDTHNGPKDLETMTNILQLRFQCDADLAGNPDTKHSQTSYLGYLGNSLICWCSTDQGSIATSTAESEIKAVNHTLKCEVIANRGILNQMGWKQAPTVIEEDNKACVDASTVPHMTRGLRHLDITQNFLKEKFTDGTCVLVKIESKNNNADIGTKRLPFPIFDYLTYPLTDRTLRGEKKFDSVDK